MSMEEQLPVGCSVEAHGLQSMAHLNGLQGVVLSHQRTDGKELVMVRFDSAPPEHQRLLLKPVNLKRPDAFKTGQEVEAHSLVSMTALNGLRGTVHSMRGSDAERRVVVEFPAPHGAMALMPTNLRAVTTPAQSAAATPTAAAAPTPPSPATAHPPPSPAMSSASLPTAVSTEGMEVGQLVEAHSLKQLVNLNGARGQVVSHRPAPDGSTQIVVQFPPPHGTMALKAPNLRPAPVGGSAPVHAAVAQLRAPAVPLPATEGFLDKKKPGGAKGSGYDKRWFSLRGSTLLYYEEKGRIQLNASSRALIGPGSTFTLQGPGMNRTFDLRAESPAKAQQWVAALGAWQAPGAKALPQLDTLCGLESAARAHVELDYWGTAPDPPTGGRLKPAAADAETDPRVAAAEARVREAEQRLAAAQADADPRVAAAEARVRELEQRLAAPDPLQEARAVSAEARAAAAEARCRELEQAAAPQPAAGAEARCRELEAKLSAAEARAAAAVPQSAAAGADAARCRDLEARLAAAEARAAAAVPQSAAAGADAARCRDLEARLAAAEARAAAAEARAAVSASAPQPADSARAAAAEAAAAAAEARARAAEEGRAAAEARARAAVGTSSAGSAVVDAERRAAAAEARCASAEARSLEVEARAAAAEARCREVVAAGGCGRCGELEARAAAAEQQSRLSAAPDPRVAALQRRVDELQRVVAQQGLLSSPRAAGAASPRSSNGHYQSPHRSPLPATNFRLAD
eukprot:TRINITY_DN14775_c0_g1_i1.p1 TRINITY_DN14775_c0_g1~~TRINITY_DN14775_c0_g1_i1.p1  ORF type:complete len:787 (+),score=351.25 TRINITY_DN14775_c0_g1_i1:124-2361(+)